MSLVQLSALPLTSLQPATPQQLRAHHQQSLEPHQHPRTNHISHQPRQRQQRKHPQEELPHLPLSKQLLQTFFRTRDGTTTKRHKGRRGRTFERDGRIFEQAWCDQHDRWEFSHSPRLTSRIPREDVTLQRKMGRQLISWLFVSFVGWPLIVFVVAWDPACVRDDVMREYTKGTAQTFHQKEIVLARVVSSLIAVLIAVALVLVGVLL